MRTGQAPYPLARNLPHFHNFYCNFFANTSSSPINSWNWEMFICCNESDSATAGSGCTSAIIKSAPIAKAALAAGNNKSLRPVECVTSTATGKCVSFSRLVQQKYLMYYVLHAHMSGFHAHKG